MTPPPVAHPRLGAPPAWYVHDGMKSPRLVATVLAFVLLALAPSSSSAGTNEIRSCGMTRGWAVTAGNYPTGGIPWTRCSFAWATYRAMRQKQREGGLSGHLQLKVRGQTLDCRYTTTTIYELRCRNPRRFVLIYKWFSRRTAIIARSGWERCGSARGRFEAGYYEGKPLGLTGSVRNVTTHAVACPVALRFAKQLYFQQSCVLCDAPDTYQPGDTVHFRGFRCEVRRGNLRLWEPQMFHCVRGGKVVNFHTTVDLG